MAQLPDGVEMAQKLWEEMKDFILTRPLTMPEFYVSSLPTKSKGWLHGAWDQISEQTIVEGSAPVFIGWDLGIEHKPVPIREPTADYLAVHRAIGFGYGDEKRMGYAQYVGSPEEGDER